jgi:hypothetical protein
MTDEECPVLIPTLWGCRGEAQLNNASALIRFIHVCGYGA